MKVPVGTLWRFKGLQEPARFAVTSVSGDSVSYCTVRDKGHEEEPTTMPLSQFLRDFERLPDPQPPDPPPVA